MLGEASPLNTAMMCSANDCNNRQANLGIFGRGPPRVAMMVVMGADFEGGLSSRIFLVLNPTPSKENINDGSDERGTLVEGPNTWVDRL